MMSKQGQWDEMAGLITDEIFDAFGIAGTPAQLTDWVIDRFGGELDRVTIDLHGADPDEAKELMARLRAA